MRKEDLRELGLKVLELREINELLLDKVRNEYAGLCIDLSYALKRLLGEDNQVSPLVEELARILVEVALPRGAISTIELSVIDKVYGRIMENASRIREDLSPGQKLIFEVLMEDLHNLVEFSKSALMFTLQDKEIETRFGEFLALAEGR